MKTTLRKDILAETYKDMEKLVSGIAWQFWRNHGGDIDDLIGQASLIFIDAFDNHDPSKSKLTTWLTIKINHGLHDYIRKGNGYKPYIQIDDGFTETHLTPSKDFSVLELLDEMEKDAHIVLQLFLDTPKKVFVDIRNSHNRIDYAQAAMRKRLRNRLRQMGWNMRRIKEAFEQLKKITSY